MLDRLRGATGSPSAVSGDTETVRRIVGQLDRLDLAQARYLAAFAYVLSRVANADLAISDVESEKMVQLVQHAGRLPEDQAILIVAIAKTQNRLFGGTEDFLVTRELREIATDEQRRDVLDCLFAVAAADDRISAEEEGRLRQIAGELGFEHAEFVSARMAYSDKRSVFRADKH